MWIAVSGLSPNVRTQATANAIPERVVKIVVGLVLVVVGTMAMIGGYVVLSAEDIFHASWLGTGLIIGGAISAGVGSALVLKEAMNG